MERKAKLFSPLLVIAMLVSLVAGAVTVMVTPQQASAQPPCTPEECLPECTVDVQTYKVVDGELVLTNVFSACEDFYVNAAVTNGSADTVLDVAATINVTLSDDPVELVEGETQTKTVTYIGAKEVGDFWWKVHCEGPGVTDIEVTVVDGFGEGQWTCSDYTTVTQTVAEGLVVTITEPEDYTSICTCQYFVVKAHIENVGAVTATGVSAKILYPGSVTTADPASYSLDTIAPGAESIVAWTMHCTEPVGATEITVTATASVPVQPDTVIVWQLEEVASPQVWVVEPVTSTDFCVDCGDPFTITARIYNDGCHTATLLNATLNITAGGGNIMVTGSPIVSVEDIGPLGYRDVSWTVECIGEGDVTFNVSVTGVDAVTSLPVSAISSPDTTFHQQVVLVEITDIGARFVEDYDGNPLTNDPASVVSTCQEFTVSATVTNCDEDLPLNNFNVTITLPAGTQLAPGSVVDIKYYSPVGQLTDQETVSPATETVLIEKICPCCDAVITWELQCIASSAPPDPPYGDPSTLITVTAEKIDVFSVDDTSLPLIQECKAHLIAGLESFPGTFSDGTFWTTAARRFSVGQTFTIVGLVSNVGEADAEDVVITISLVGDYSIVKGANPQTIGDIPGGDTRKAIWEVKCTGIEPIEVLVFSVTGTDVNTGLPILKDNIDTPCTITIEQAVSDLTVEIIQPPPPDPVTVCQEFVVKALITNIGDVVIYNVSGVVSWDPITGASLVPEQTFSKSVGDIAPATTHEVAWVLHCDAPGPLTITVTAISTNPPHEAYDTVTVEQTGPPALDVDILSPDGGIEIATSQEFAYTVVVRNTGVTTATGVTASVGYRDAVGTGDGSTTTFELDYGCISPGTETIYVNGVPLVGVGAYTIQYTNILTGVGSITLTTPPASGASIDAFYLPMVSVVEPGQTQELGDMPPMSYKIVSWTLHADSTCHWVGYYEAEVDIEAIAAATNLPCVPVLDGPGTCPADDISIYIYPAAHLVVDIIAPEDGAEVTVCQIFDVVATVTNTGQADAWEVEAVLSVEPESSARLALSGDDARAGYTKYIGTLVGWGENESATVTWTLHCKEACNSTITVTARGIDETGCVYNPKWADRDCSDVVRAPIGEDMIEPDSVTVKQVEPPLLVVESLISPAQVEVCQDFTVSAIVKNVGGSTATDVEATLDLTGLDASLTAGSLIHGLGDIEAGSLKVASWELHCDGAGSGAITVTADADNALPAMAAGGVLQVVPAAAVCLDVEVDAPAQITVEQSYYVTAVVSNLCGVEACDVVATIAISGEAEVASGETLSKDLGCVNPGDSVAVDWEVDCTGVGGVNIWVSVTATGTNTAIDSVTVRQAEVLDLSDLTKPLSEINAKLSSIDDNVVTMTSDVGTIKTDIASINLKVTSIDDGVATIETNLGTLKGTVTDISDDVATIATDVGIVKADVSEMAGDSGTVASRSIWTLPILILVAIGAIAVIVGVAIMASRKRPVPVVIERKEE